MNGVMHAPLVTIVLACGSDPEAIERSLRSIRAQTIQPFEILAINLAFPADCHPRLASPAGDAPIQVIGGGEGIASASNAAAARCQTRYICFLQPGDEIEETYLEKCLFHLEVASLDVCGSWQLRGGELFKAGPFTLRALLARNVSVPAVIRGEALLRAGGYDPTIAPQFLTWELWVRMAAHGARGRLLPEPLMRTRDVPGDEPPQAAFVGQGYGHLLSDVSSVLRLDAVRAKAPPLNSYGALLEAARQSEKPGVIVAMPFLSMGGAERAMAGLSRELTHLGFRVLVVTTERAPVGSGDTSHWFRGNVVGLYHLPQFLDASLQPAFLAYLIQRHSIRVLLQVGSGSVYRWLPRLKELIAGIAVVDLLFNPAGHADSYLKNRELIDHVVVEHEGMAAWLAECGEPRARVTVIPNAADVERFTPQAPKDWRTGEPRREDSFVVGFFGRLAEEKAPDTFIQIATRLRGRPGLQFLICGTGPMETSLRALCQERALEQTVHFLGFVDTHIYLPCCHLTVVCSRLDGRPNIILESLAMGVPVVASCVGGIPEMAREGRGIILCEPEDVEGFCAAIERLAGDREGHLQLADAGRRWVVGWHSMEGSAGMYSTLFRQLMGTSLWPARSAQTEAAIARAMLPASRQIRPLPRRWLRASISIIGHALSRPNISGTFRTVFTYALLRRDPVAARAFKELFDADYYALCYPDVVAAGIPLVWHYLFMGFREGRDPSPLFSTDYYLGAHPDIAATGLNPLIHYCKWGRAEGRDSSPTEDLLAS